MAFFKLILSFAPWIAFLIVAQGSLFRLKLGLVIALALSVVMGVARLHRGVILWAGLAFFTYATVALLVFDNMWTVRHIGVLANATLALGSAATIAIGQPFTLAYARQNTHPALWQQPTFIRTNVVITAAWASVFAVNAVLAWGKMDRVLLPDWGYEVVSYALLIAVAAFTTWYPGWVRRRRLAGGAAPRGLV